MTDVVLHTDQLQTHLVSDGVAVPAVDHVSFELRRNRTFALLGESGCGKSMTALSLMRLLPAAGRIVGGSVLLGTQDLLALPEMSMRSVRGGRISMIFQEPQTSLNPVLTVGEQVGETLRRHKRLAGKAERDRVVALLQEVGIPDPQRRLREYPHQLSGGMKQRVMIANALAGEPEVLIADEPTTALDVTIQAQVLALLKRLQHETGMAILLITHDLGVVAEMADDVAVMYAGHIVERAPCEQFFAQPKHPYAQALFGSLPRVDKRDQPLAVIAGTVPPLSQRFAGCRFANRCQHTWPRCEQRPPRWTAIADDRFVRCHLYDSSESPPSSRKRDTSVVTQREQPSAAAAHDRPLLRAEQLKVHFAIHRGVFKHVVGWVRAVDGVSLEVRSGQTVALVGESGCGKTTAGKGILQLIRPTGGSVNFADVDLTQLSAQQLRPRRREMQIIFQDPYASMNPRMMVGDVIAEGLVAQRLLGPAARQSRVDELLQQVGLPREAKQRYPHEFSGGQRQRICIARALAVNPRLIVCDEPTSALDVSVQAQILNLLKDLQQRLSLAYLFITHDISVVEYLAHEVAVMYLGRVVEYGRSADVLGSPQHPYTQDLLAAVPVPDPQRRRGSLRIKGELPSPAAPPPGCHYHPRCPKATPACAQSYPATHSLGGGHVTACHLFADREE